MMQIFWCFSNFIQLHPLLANYRVGAITLKIVEFEIRRHELRLEEEKELEENKNTSDEAFAKYEREKKRNKKRMRKQDELL
jgi:hypothetical protein